MQIPTQLRQFYDQAKANKWMRRSIIFSRIALAAGFIPSGIVKIMGERFTSLSVNHPMGHYLEALHLTGYYYTFIGIAQVTAAILLLIPRTATLGALLYFPIIFNICILSLAVRFDGSLITSPLMVLANLYLICWDYDKLKYIVSPKPAARPQPTVLSNKFPFKFFGGAFVTVVLLVLIIHNIFELKPRNTLSDCRTQCPDSKNPAGCYIFCDCIHKKGQPLNKSLDEYQRSVKAMKH